MGHLFCTILSIVHHFKDITEFKLELQSGNAQFGPKSAIFCPVWPWNLIDDLEKNRAPLLCYFKLCALFHSHLWVQTGVTVRKRPIRVKIDDFFSHVNLQFDGWPWKTIGHLFYATSSFVHNFVAIGKFKMELQSGNANLDQNRRFFVSCDLDIWRMTLKNNRAPLLCYFKLCTSFRSHMWIQTGVTVRKWQNWVLTSVTLTFDLWPWPFALTSLLSMAITPENFMMVRWQEHSEKGVTDRQTDRQTDGPTDGQTHKTVSCGYFCP